MTRSIAGALCTAIGIFLLVFAREWHRWVSAMYAVGTRAEVNHLPILSLALGTVLIGAGLWLMFGAGKAKGAS